jgi:hypothetical protein
MNTRKILFFSIIVFGLFLLWLLAWFGASHAQSDGPVIIVPGGGGGGGSGGGGGAPLGGPGIVLGTTAGGSYPGCGGAWNGKDPPNLSPDRQRFNPVTPQQIIQRDKDRIKRYRAVSAPGIKSRKEKKAAQVQPSGY